MLSNPQKILSPVLYSHDLRITKRLIHYTVCGPEKGNSISINCIVSKCLNAFNIYSPLNTLQYFSIKHNLSHPLITRLMDYPAALGSRLCSLFLNPSVFPIPSSLLSLPPLTLSPFLQGWRDLMLPSLFPSHLLSHWPPLSFHHLASFRHQESNCVSLAQECELCQGKAIKNDNRLEQTVIINEKIGGVLAAERGVTANRFP